MNDFLSLLKKQTKHVMVACRVTSSALHRLQGSQACWCELAARRLGGSPAAPGSGRHSEKMAGGAQPSSRRPALKPVRPQPFPARTQPTLVVPSPSHALSHARISPPLRQTSSPGLLASTVNRYLNAAVLFFHINCRGSLFVPQVTVFIGSILLCILCRQRVLLSLGLPPYRLSANHTNTPSLSAATASDSA